MLRLTTLPIPNHPGMLETKRIVASDVIRIVRDAKRAFSVVSHIGYADAHDDLQELVGVSIPTGERHLPKPEAGDQYITVRKRNRDDRLDDCEFLLTVYRPH